MKLKPISLFLFYFVFTGCTNNQPGGVKSSRLDTVAEPTTLTSPSASETDFSPTQGYIASKRIAFQRRFLNANKETKATIQKEWFNWINTYLVDSLHSNAEKFNCKINYRNADLIVGDYIVIGEFDIGNQLYVSTQENFKTATAQRNSLLYKKLYSVDESKSVVMAFKIKEVEQMLVNRIGDKLDDPVISINLVSIKN
ncbi:MAG TPA: hypothetical protein VGB63_12955 [Pedobacter sp.]|jgi:hypothetical protein